MWATEQSFFSSPFCFVSLERGCQRLRVHTKLATCFYFQHFLQHTAASSTTTSCHCLSICLSPAGICPKGEKLSAQTPTACTRLELIMVGTAHPTNSFSLTQSKWSWLSFLASSKWPSVCFSRPSMGITTKTGKICWMLACRRRWCSCVSSVTWTCWLS